MTSRKRRILNSAHHFHAGSSILTFPWTSKAAMDAGDMYDEFGNYIGPDIESDESEKGEEEEEEREVRIN